MASVTLFLKISRFSKLVCFIYDLVQTKLKNDFFFFKFCYLSTDLTKYVRILIKKVFVLDKLFSFYELHLNNPKKSFFVKCGNFW